MDLDLEKALAFEERWDMRLGGASTRPFRELLGYIAARLLRTTSTEVDDLKGYFSEMLDLFARDALTANRKGLS